MTLAFINLGHFVLLWMSVAGIVFGFYYGLDFMENFFRRRELIRRREIEERVAASLVRATKETAKDVARDSLKLAFKLKITSKQPEQVCPICKDLIEEDIIECNRCSTIAHEECLVEICNRKCPTIGCGNRII